MNTVRHTQQNTAIRALLTGVIMALTCCPAGMMSGTANAQGRNLREVTVRGHRPMKEIGTQLTRLDSAALKENIGQSIADVLTYNSSVFVKSAGRATLSTVAFRGTSPSHTLVTWNGMKINSPMLGMTDFSTIPSYFMDNASLLHGASSVSESGGGLGGAIRLGSTAATATDGLGIQYIQGIGSFRTFDEFARISYSNEKWSASTKAMYSSSANDYKYTNHDKKLNIYDDDKNIIGQYYPRERNRNGAYHDLNILQNITYNTLRGDRISLSAWYIDSDRELPLLTTDYTESARFENRQREQTLRAVINWTHNRSRWKTSAGAGYIHTSMAYDYSRQTAAGGPMSAMTRSRSRINTIHGYADGEFMPDRRWLLTASLSADQHLVLSHDKTVTTADGNDRRIGYDVGRIEASGAISAKWKPSERIGLSATLRKELQGTEWVPLIPALFAEIVLVPHIGLEAKGSIIRNHRFPSLNDMYFMPGGNPDLRSEHGISYDCSMGLPDLSITDTWHIGTSVAWFDSHIDDWIIWLPTTKGFFSPRNVKKVHAYGIEANAHTEITINRDWHLSVNGSYSWTPSVNEGEKMSDADISTGKQLPYVPRQSASMTANLKWRTWSLLYKWCHYSRRFTMSSNETTLTGQLPAYYMNNISVEKLISFRPADVSLKLAVNNLFNEDYLSILSHPMPGINFEFFISITPRLPQKKPHHITESL